MCSAFGFRGGSVRNNLQSNKRVGVRYHLASIYACVDWSGDYPVAADSSTIESC